LQERIAETFLKECNEVCRATVSSVLHLNTTVSVFEFSFMFFYPSIRENTMQQVAILIKNTLNPPQALA